MFAFHKNKPNQHQYRITLMCVILRDVRYLHVMQSVCCVLFLMYVELVWNWVNITEVTDVLDRT